MRFISPCTECSLNGSCDHQTAVIAAEAGTANEQAAVLKGRGIVVIKIQTAEDDVVEVGPESCPDFVAA